MPLFTPIGPAASPRTKPAPGTPAARALALAPSAPSALVPHTNGLTSKKPPSNDGHPDGLVAYQFARALEQMLVRQETRRLAGDGDAVMSDASPPSAGIPLELSLQLVTAYEAICEEEAARLDTLLSHSSAGDAAPALAAEREVLRGERNSWNLLRWLYHDWTAGRQAAPPAFPEPPADWARALRELGPQPGGGESSPSPTPGGLSGAPAEAGLACALLHDEAVQEAAILAADPLLDLGLRAVAWLEGIAADALRTKGYAALDAHPRNTAFLINQGVGDAPSSLDPDAPFREGKSLDGRDLEAQAAMLRALWHYVRAGQIREAQGVLPRLAPVVAGGVDRRRDGVAVGWRQGQVGRQPAAIAVARRVRGDREAGGGAEGRGGVRRRGCGLRGAIRLRRGAPPARHAAPHHTTPRRTHLTPHTPHPLPSSLQLLDTHVTPRCASWEDALWARLRLPLRARLATLQSSLSAAADDWPRPAPGVGADDLAPQLDVRRAQLQSALAAQRLPFAELKRLIAAAAADPADPAAADGTAAAAAAAAAGAHRELQGAILRLRAAQAPGRPPTARGAPTCRRRRCPTRRRPTSAPSAPSSPRMPTCTSPQRRRARRRRRRRRAAPRVGSSPTASASAPTSVSSSRGSRTPGPPAAASAAARARARAAGLGRR